jgi:hypothetical protein
MGRVKNYPRNIFEQFDIELCDLERKVKRLGLTKDSNFPIFNKHRLPMNIRQGEGFFCDDTGEFCIRYGDKLYCIPGPTATVGPTLFSGDLETVWDPVGNASHDVYTPYVMTSPTDYARIDYARADTDAFINHVWNHDFTKIGFVSYAPSAGHFTAGTNEAQPQSGQPIYLRVLDVNTRSYVDVDSTTIGFETITFSPDGNKIAYGGKKVSGIPYGYVKRLYTRNVDGTGPVYDLGMCYGPSVWTQDSEYVISDIGDDNNVTAYKWDNSEAPRSLGVPFNNIDTLYISPDGEKLVSPWFGFSGSDETGLTFIDISNGSQEFMTFSDKTWPPGTTSIFHSGNYPADPQVPIYHPSGDWVLFGAETQHIDSLGNTWGNYRNWDYYAVHLDGTGGRRFSLGNHDQQAHASANPPYCSNAYCPTFSTEGVVMRVLHYNRDAAGADFSLDQSSQTAAFDFDTGEGRLIVPITRNSFTGPNYVGKLWFVWHPVGVPYQTFYGYEGASIHDF